jgi:hypothetical protein
MTLETPQYLRLRSGDIAWREIDGEIVALDAAAGRYVAINGSGATLWRALLEGATATDLVDLLVQRYDVSQVVAATDVHEFVEQLAGRRWLEETS